MMISLFIIFNGIWAYTTALTPPRKDSKRSFAGAITVPDGFTVDVVAEGFQLPTDMTVLPSGELLVVEKGIGQESGSATIYRVRDPLGTVVVEGVLTLGTNPVGDSGVLGIVADPDFSQNGYFYVWYATRGTAYEWTTFGSSKYRLSRFTLDETNGLVDPNSELIVLDDIPRAYYHNGGGLAFDNNGYLYIATGDTSNTDWMSHPAQDLASPLGKVLRILPTETGYVVPSDNPFVTMSGALPEIFALGLRNPFKTAVAADGSVVVGDVGFEVWEEVNMVAANANYGWPMREGPCPRGVRLPCTPDATYTEPVMYYEHPVGTNCCVGGSVSGLAFYEGGVFPEIYQQQLFVADFAQTFLAFVSLPQGLYTPPHFSDDAGTIVDVEYDNDVLYWLDLWQGRILRLRYVGDDTPPIARLTTTDLLGAAPLTVTFSAEQSVNPQVLPLTYQWQWGDGSAVVTSTVPIISHTYTSDGTYTAQLIVLDSEGRASNPDTAVVNVYSGELPQIELTNMVLTGSNKVYRGGDTFMYEAVRATGVADLDPITPYTWRIDLHHHQHSHPLLVGHEATSDHFAISSTDHGSIELWYRFHLQMHINTGQTVRVRRDLLPHYETVSVVTTPTLPIMARFNEQATHQLPHSYTAIVGVEQQVAVQTAVFVNHALYTFKMWADTLATEPGRHFVTPDGGNMYVAVYENTPPQMIWLPLVMR